MIPHSIQVELVKGCNRACWFCPFAGALKSERTDYKYMEPELLKKMFTELNGWLPKIRVEIDLRGEPTLHPEPLRCLATIRAAMPSAHIQLQTNTDFWHKDGRTLIPSMFAAGLNMLVLNCYAPGRYEWFLEHLRSWGLPFVDFYHNNPEHKSTYCYNPPTKQQIFVLDNLGTVEGKPISKRLHSSAGSSDEQLMLKMCGRKPSQTPRPNKCSKIFRELVVQWDGTVPACCLDWQAEMVLGNAKTQHLREIWQGGRFDALRKLTYRKSRAVRPCCKCDDSGIRVGLIKPPEADPRSNEELKAFLEGKWAQ